MFSLGYAEVMASYACNLSCVGCTNYSDYNYTGFPTWEIVDRQIRDWLSVLRFESFGIIGGEPLLNPQLDQWIRGIRKAMVDTEILLVTNGSRLRFFPYLVDLMAENEPSKLTVAAHHEFETVERNLLSILDESGHKYLIQQHHYTDRDGKFLTQQNFVLEDHQTSIELYRPRVFIKSYQNFGVNMKPWKDKDPKGAIELCACRYCPLLYEGRLYKCSQIALLKNHLGKLGLLDDEDWQPYLNYKGIDPTDDVQEIQRFVRSFGKPERICGMCPSKGHPDAIIDHTVTVLTKKEWQHLHGTKWPPKE